MNDDPTSLKSSGAGSGAPYDIMDEMTALYSMMSAKPFLEPGLDDTTVVLLCNWLNRKVFAYVAHLPLSKRYR
jgi:hypothetical protein